MDALQARLKAIGELQPAMRALQFSTIAEAQAIAVSHKKSGHLMRSIVPGSVSATNAVVEVRVPYAASMEFGAKPHIIKPKNGKVLAWATTAAGRTLTGRMTSAVRANKPGLGGKGGIKLVGEIGPNSGAAQFATLVHHPGNKPFPYLIPGAKKALEKAGILGEIVTRWNKAG